MTKSRPAGPSNRRPAPPAARRGVLRSLASATILLAVVVLLPGGIAAGVSPPHLPHSLPLVVLAPFSRMTPELQKFLSTQFCNSSAGFLDSPRASTSTGNASFSMFAHANACPDHYASTFLTASVGFSGLAFTARSSAPLEVSFHWNLSWNGSLSAVIPPNASIYDSQAFAQFYEEDSVVDLGTGFEVQGDFIDIWDSTIWNSSQTFGQAGFNTNGTVQFTPTAGDSYDFAPALYVTMSTYADPGCHAHGSMNLATGGDGARLVSVTLW